VERVAFLVEETGARLVCLLNPESVIVRRTAGIRRRYVTGKPLAGEHLSDEPLLYSGGGRTEILLDLLFDISLPGSTIQSEDVRDLTQPLWNLAENAPRRGPYGQPTAVRFVWGKAWNIPAVVAAVAERLERFSAGGAPGRSWLRMKLLRRPEPGRDRALALSTRDGVTASQAIAGAPVVGSVEVPRGGHEVRLHRVLGSGEPGRGERLDQIAARYYGAPDWRPIAITSGISNPLDLPENALLRIPDGTYRAGRP
jgi:hypothetical protein